MVETLTSYFTDRILPYFKQLFGENDGGWIRNPKHTSFSLNSLHTFLDIFLLDCWRDGGGELYLTNRVHDGFNLLRELIEISISIIFESLDNIRSALSQ